MRRAMLPLVTMRLTICLALLSNSDTTCAIFDSFFKAFQ
jgi:hypothetical protein